MVDKKTKPTPGQLKKTGRDGETGKFVVISPAQQKRIEETIEELEAASHRIDEARRFLRPT